MQNETDTGADGMAMAGLGVSQRSVLEQLKAAGQLTVPELASRVGLNVETLRHHLASLISARLVERRGTRRRGPGRPEVVYGLDKRAEAVFPRREGEVLRSLAEYLKATNNEPLLASFFEQYIGERREAALSRVTGLEGRDRVAEAARILTELGFMARAEEEDGAAGSRLRLCHCPIRDLVDATKIPCRAEIGFVQELLGADLTRVSYIPAGDASCCYRTVAA
jgi:predicted ArsR family transcriptional regulator